MDAVAFVEDFEHIFEEFFDEMGLAEDQEPQDTESEKQLWVFPESIGVVPPLYDGAYEQAEEGILVLTIICNHVDLTECRQYIKKHLVGATPRDISPTNDSWPMSYAGGNIVNLASGRIIWQERYNVPNSGAC